jgi:hypothetical protein
MLPIVSKPAIKLSSSKVGISTILADSCRDITFFKLVMTDRIDWFIGWQFDEVRLDKETVKSSVVNHPRRTHDDASACVSPCIL